MVVTTCSAWSNSSAEAPGGAGSPLSTVDSDDNATCEGRHTAPSNSSAVRIRNGSGLFSAVSYVSTGCSLRDSRLRRMSGNGLIVVIPVRPPSPNSRSTIACNRWPEAPGASRGTTAPMTSAPRAATAAGRTKDSATPLPIGVPSRVERVST